MRRALLGLSALLAASSLAAAGCGSPACQFRGTINEPSNKSMRQSMLRAGMGDFCKQMLAHDAPLKLSPDSPVIGRFYPTQCSSPEPGDTLYASFAGFGYGYTNLTKKVTFTAQGAALYKYDFIVTEGDRCDVYAYFRPARVDTSAFVVHRVEGTAASVLNAFTNAGATFGQQLLTQKLQQGITVIAYDGKTNQVDFGLGIIPLGQKPFHPYAVHGSDKITYEDERTEVHQNERDFVGPIQVEGSGRAIYVTASLDGAPAVDVMLMRKAEADASLQLYFEYAQSGPLAAPPMTDDVLQAGVPLNRAVPVPPGMYYVVFDNTPSAGQVNPPVSTFDDRAAVVNYLIQIGDAT